MKYKALILDLDGTTIPNHPDGRPSKRVQEAISRAKAFVHVCIATGRPLSLALPVIDHLELTGPCIITSGTQIYDPVSKRVVEEISLSESTVALVAPIIAQYSVPTYINTSEGTFLFSDTTRHGAILNVFLESLVMEQADSIIEELKDVPGIAVHKVRSWHEGRICIEIPHAEGTKLHGITRVAKRLGITYEELIGVGDAYNDFSLLMACGLKIAMGNAVPELKAIADFIAPSVDDDGVATIIEKFILA